MDEIAASRRLLGWLLLWALAPMPFLYIILPPFWLITGGVGLFVVLWPERIVRPSATLLNLVAVLILVVVVVTGGLHVGPLRPLGHLLLLLTAVRVLVVDDRRSFVRALALVGMVWIVSVSASTHIAVSLYFVASAVVIWWLGIRLHMTSLGIDVTTSSPPIPRPRHVAIASAAALVIAAPFFVVMPRLGAPWIAGSSFARSTGFSPDVDLGKLGRVTASQEVALVVRAAEGGTIRREWTRLRGTAFDQVMAGSWLPRRTNLRRLDTSRGVGWLRPEVGTLDGSVELEVDLLRPRHYLMIPPGTVAVQAPTDLALDPYGGLFFGSRHGEPLHYRLWVSDEAPPRAAPPSARDTRLPRSDPRVRQLADEVAGNLAGAAARAEAVERFLQTRYRYALNSGVTIHTEDPVAWFLFDGREGHCEFFAGSMVVMLRHLGVPARMVAGYGGGELSPDRDELVVRESNAHAWVEVWLGADRGWVTYDPTPAIGVPGLAGMTGAQRLRWSWQQLEQLWDSRLLTFGLAEQVDLVDGVTGVVQRLGRWLVEHAWAALSTLVGIVVLTVGALAVKRRGVRRWVTPMRERGPASRTVARLARALVPVGGVIPPSATVRSIGGQAAAFWPSVAPAVAELVTRAEEELYGGARPSDPAEIGRLWRDIRRGMNGREPA